MNPSAIEIVAKLQRAGYIAYFAGGCVRDELLHSEFKDFNIATSAKPEDVLRLFPNATDVAGESFGVVQVVVGDNSCQIAMFRRGDAHTNCQPLVPVQPATPEEDAQRRDFTVNALFLDPIAGSLVDYVGGEADLRAGIIRMIGNPADRFAKDPLLPLRAIRFASQLLFRIAPKTWDAMNAGAVSIRTISAERIRDELNKILTAPKPEVGLDLLDMSGLLAEVLPDIAAFHGVEFQPQDYPKSDLFQHVRLMLSKIDQPNLNLALGILFHDVGKKLTAASNEHESVNAEIAEKIMASLNYDEETIHTVRELIQHQRQFKQVPHLKPSALKRMMARPTFPLEIDLYRIDCICSHGDLKYYEFLKHTLAKPPDTGSD